MAKCPWFAHDVAPDPAVVGLTKNEIGLCTVCSLFYVVKRVNPYKLAKADAASAPVLAAIAMHGTAKARAAVAPLLERKLVRAEIKRLRR